MAAAHHQMRFSPHCHTVDFVQALLQLANSSGFGNHCALAIKQKSQYIAAVLAVSFQALSSAAALRGINSASQGELTLTEKAVWCTWEGINHGLLSHGCEYGHVIVYQIRCEQDVDVAAAMTCIQS